MNKINFKVILVISIFMFTVCMTGCSKNEKGNVVNIKKTPYEPITYNTVTVQKGDIEPVITLSLKVEDYENINYQVDKDDFAIDTIYVSVGDKVKKGDILISFKAEDIKQELAQYEEQLSTNELLVSHYENLMKIDSSNDYKTDIAMLNQDIKVEKLYIKEIKEKLSNYCIVAEKDGTISYVNDLLASGYVVSGTKLISEASGLGTYAASCVDEYDFEVGDIFSAVSGVATYDLKVKSVVKNKNSDGELASDLIFEPVSDMSAVSEQDVLTMQITKQAIENAVFVDKDALFKVEDDTYVYVLDDLGYRDAVKVETGDTVDEYVVISNGLSGGEQVTVD